MRVLITGFEPFGGESVNPSGMLAEMLAEGVDGCEVTSRILPVSFRRAPLLAREAIEEIHPDAVLCLGQAGGIDTIHLERRGVNLANAKSPDNDGARPLQQPLIEGAAAHLDTLFPIDTLAARLQHAGHPVTISDSAGLYVCNALYFTLLHHYPSLPILFIHLPYTPAQAAAKTPAPPSLPLDTARAALTTLLTATSTPTHSQTAK